jgi:Helix-turn-helix domain
MCRNACRACGHPVLRTAGGHVHPQTSTQQTSSETDKTDPAGACQLATLQGLGQYLRNLRENRRVTQESLSAKTGAIAGRTITRSRISEIENAKRDAISERELRVYMAGLKCTTHHIDRMVKALRLCTATSPSGSVVDPLQVNSATLDPPLVRRSDTDNDPAQLKNKFDGDRTKIGPEKEGCEPRSPATVTIDPPNASPPSRGRGLRPSIAIIAATGVLAGAVSTGLSIKFLPRPGGVDQPTLPGNSIDLLVPPGALMPQGNPDFRNNAITPGPVLTQVDESSDPAPKTQKGPGLRKTAGRDTVPQVVGPCCPGEKQPQVANPFVSPHIARAWHLSTNSWDLQPGGTQLADDMMP